MPEPHLRTGTRIPLSPQLFACFSSVVDGETGDRVLDLADRLRRQHVEQWQAEDLSRTAAGDDHVLADVKRHIDQLNVARARFIDELDTELALRLPQEPAAPLHTETLGSVIDRICIAWVRTDKIARTGRGERRAQLAGHQMQELAHAYDVLVTEVTDGRRRDRTGRPSSRTERTVVESSVPPPRAAIHRQCGGSLSLPRAHGSAGAPTPLSPLDRRGTEGPHRVGGTHPGRRLARGVPEPYQAAVLPARGTVLLGDLLLSMTVVRALLEATEAMGGGSSPVTYSGPYGRLMERCETKFEIASGNRTGTSSSRRPGASGAAGSAPRGPSPVAGHRGEARPENGYTAQLARPRRRTRSRSC